MIITTATENMAHNRYVHQGRESSPRFPGKNTDRMNMDSVSISDEARESYRMDIASPLVRAVCRYCPDCAGLVRDIEAEYDRQRAEKVRRVRALLMNGTSHTEDYESGNDAA